MLTTQQKLDILADAAKYDASCASSGSGKRHSRASGKGIGSTEGMGICHSYTPDGRCVSLLKILLTNFCVYDCAYCVNRVSSNVARARFSVDEVVTLTLDFYKRNYIEGLFLSSGIIRNADYTMEQMVEVARRLREEHRFAGYIHLKTIPEASPELLASAGRHADRLSINVELPTEAGLTTLAPEKTVHSIRGAMGELRLAHRGSAGGNARPRPRWRRPSPAARGRSRRVSAPAGQSTQMIVGADGASDQQILTSADSLYGNYRMRRVYYSAFSPIPDASRQLPLQAPPLQREHRLYQADWLLRFYGFAAGEILAGVPGGMLDLAIDPKLAWALRHRRSFPVDVNRAEREMLLRIPGLGARAVDRIIETRRFRHSLRLADPDAADRCAAPGPALHRRRRSSADPAAGPGRSARPAGTAAETAVAVRLMRAVRIDRPDDLDRFRQAARSLIAADVPPDQVSWHEGTGDLPFGDPVPEAAKAPTLAVPGRFQELAETAICHRDPERFALLYTALWRLVQGERDLLHIASDPLVHRLGRMAGAVHRDAHKMTAFLRFRADRKAGWDGALHRVVRAGASHPASCRAVLHRPVRGDGLVDPGAGWRRCTGTAGRWTSGQAWSGGTRPTAMCWRRHGATTTPPPSTRRGPTRPRCGRRSPKKYWRNLPEATL